MHNSAFILYFFLIYHNSIKDFALGPITNWPMLFSRCVCVFSPAKRYHDNESKRWTWGSPETPPDDVATRCVMNEWRFDAVMIMTKWWETNCITIKREIRFFYWNATFELELTSLLIWLPFQAGVLESVPGCMVTSRYIISLSPVYIIRHQPLCSCCKIIGITVFYILF